MQTIKYARFMSLRPRKCKGQLSYFRHILTNFLKFLLNFDTFFKILINFVTFFKNASGISI